MDNVYFAVDEQDHRVKIGFSGNVPQRIKALQGQEDNQLYVAATTPGGRRRERQLHDRWSGLRLDGEWFTMASQISSFIESLPKTTPIFAEVRPGSGDHLITRGYMKLGSLTGPHSIKEPPKQHLTRLIKSKYRKPKGGIGAIAKAIGRPVEATRAVLTGFRDSHGGGSTPPMLKDGALAVIHCDLWAPGTPREEFAVAFLRDLFGEQPSSFWDVVVSAGRTLAGPTEHEAEAALKDFQARSFGGTYGPGDQSRETELIAILDNARGRR